MSFSMGPSEKQIVEGSTEMLQYNNDWIFMH